MVVLEHTVLTNFFSYSIAAAKIAAPKNLIFKFSCVFRAFASFSMFIAVATPGGEVASPCGGSRRRAPPGPCNGGIDWRLWLRERFFSILTFRMFRTCQSLKVFSDVY